MNNPFFSIQGRHSLMRSVLSFCFLSSSLAKTEETYKVANTNSHSYFWLITIHEFFCPVCLLVIDKMAFPFSYCREISVTWWPWMGKQSFQMLSYEAPTIRLLHSLCWKNWGGNFSIIAAPSWSWREKNKFQFPQFKNHIIVFCCCLIEMGSPQKYML